jgi:NAD(P)-dependent dehydrogenase (short-subunit alcohol dehydrogenase family)
VRDTDNVKDLIDEVVRRLGRLDVLVYNSGAIWWSAIETTPVKRFKLLQQVNPEGLYAAVSAALPHFGSQGWKGRIIVVSPPIYSRFFRGKTAYAMGKVAMSVLTKGLAMDFVRQGRKEMAITSIWPASVSLSTLGHLFGIVCCWMQPFTDEAGILLCAKSPSSQPLLKTRSSAIPTRSKIYAKR